jgi:hypothetical protein
MSNSKKLKKSKKANLSHDLMFIDNDYGSFLAKLKYLSHLDSSLTIECEFDENWEAKLDDQIEAIESFRKAGHRYFDKLQIAIR